MGNTSSTPFEACLNAVCAGRGDCAGFPSDPFYQMDWVNPFNLNIPVAPVAVVRPSSAEDVSGFVKCAGQYDIKVQAKSGGHSYAYVSVIARKHASRNKTDPGIAIMVGKRRRRIGSSRQTA